MGSTQSANRVRAFRVRIELYGEVTTSSSAEGMMGVLNLGVRVGLG